MDKECLVNELTIQLAESSNIPIKALKEIINTTLLDYSVQRIEQTLPSTGDGTTTLYILKEFAKHKANNGMKPNAFKQYEMVVRKICGYCQKEINLIDDRDINDFFIYYKSTGVSASTVAHKRALLSSIFSFMQNYNYIAKNPFGRVDKIKYTRIKEKALTKKQEEILKLACEKENTKQSRRMIAMIYFMLDSGVRVTEMCNIKLKDVDFENKRVMILGKGDKYREVYFTDSTVIRLQNYFKDREDIEEDSYGVDTYLFASLDREHHQLTKAQVSKDMVKLRKMSGITNLHCHLFRRTFATRLAEKNIPLTVIAELMGHSDTKTTEGYISLTDRKKKEYFQMVA